MHRFLSRLWRIATDVADATEMVPAELVGEPTPLARKAHWAIDRATSSMERLTFNTAISAVMELVNDCYRDRDELLKTRDGAAQLRFAIATAGSLIFPFAPHLGAEVYGLIAGERVWGQPWPKADPQLLTSDTVEVVVQVNGKLRDRVAMPADATREAQEELARGSAKVAAHLNGGEIVKTIVVPGKLVNFVVR